MKLSHLSVVTYATPDQVKKIVSAKSSQLRYAEMAYHDRDDGKDPHTHINLWLVNPRDGQDIRKWFKACTDHKNDLANTFYEPTHSTEGAHDYLTHKGHEGKYQYEDSIIKVLCGSTEEYLESTTDEEEKRQYAERRAKDKEALREAQADDVEAQLQAIIEGVSYRDMARRYGRDYIKNRKAYNEYVLMMCVEETGEIPEHLIDDPLQQLINKKVREATVAGADFVTNRLQSLFHQAITEVGLEDNIAEHIIERVAMNVSRRRNDEGI